MPRALRVCRAFKESASVQNFTGDESDSVSRTRHRSALLMLRCGVFNRPYTEQSMFLNPQFCAWRSARTLVALDKSCIRAIAPPFDSD
jgi:hypothetical protein